MQIGIIKESLDGEKRVAATPDTVKKLTDAGFAVEIEKEAGMAAGHANAVYAQAGATISDNAAGVLGRADVLLKVRAPNQNELAQIKEGALVIGLLDPHNRKNDFPVFAAKKLNCFSLELVPRISRAQAMDVLSSQSNLAGYKAVIEAASHYPRAFPMMMTAAGTLAPARVLVMGAGVAGLQAIATARRLGAIVSATDVRLAAKEQVESLGASFVMVEDEETKAAETSGGYAKEMSDAYKQKQAALIAETIKKQNIVITTALIPGRSAPRLVTDAMVKTMKAGSVIIDLAAEQGGNCEGVKLGETVDRYGIKIIGPQNMASMIAADASQLYAKNILNFLALIFDFKTGSLAVQWDDAIIKATALTKNGEAIHSVFK